MTGLSDRQRTVFILGASSDIGRALVERHAGDGDFVIGTYRTIDTVSDLVGKPDIHFIPCDVARPESVAAAVATYARMGRPWDVFISAVGTEEPIGRFFECDFDEWERSVVVNSTAQLRVLHALHPYRTRHTMAAAVFFAGGGTNNVFPNYSAYCVSKIALIKMCELLDVENEDLAVFIVGPGWVRTKIHEQTLRSPAAAGANYERTLEFVRSDRPGTSYDDIYACIAWCLAEGREVAGGRNFSIVHDPWRDGGAALATWLRGGRDLFKLRRSGNAAAHGVTTGDHHG